MQFIIGNRRDGRCLQLSFWLLCIQLIYGSSAKILSDLYFASTFDLQPAIIHDTGFIFDL